MIIERDEMMMIFFTISLLSFIGGGSGLGSLPRM